MGACLRILRSVRVGDWSILNFGKPSVHIRVTALKYRGGNRKERLPDVALDFLSGSLLPVWPWQSTGASWMGAPALLLDPSRDRQLAGGQGGEAKLQLFPPSSPSPWAVLQYVCWEEERSFFINHMK